MAASLLHTGRWEPLTAQGSNPLHMPAGGSVAGEAHIYLQANLLGTLSLHRNEMARGPHFIIAPGTPPKPQPLLSAWLAVRDKTPHCSSFLAPESALSYSEQ